VNDLLHETAASLRAKIAQEAAKLRVHVDGSAASMNRIEELQRTLDGLEQLQQPLALPIGGQPLTYAKLP
jgi:hypothetical protein